jgi:hypothetical protein
VLTAAVPAAAAETGASVMTCTNPVSGASWQIQIDFDRNSVDTYPARISAGEINWRDPIGRKFSLDRKSGKLTVTLASATGGNFLYDQCKPDN